MGPSDMSAAVEFAGLGYVEAANLAFRIREGLPLRWWTSLRYEV